MVTAMPFGYVISEREWGRSLPIVSSYFLTSAKKVTQKKGKEWIILGKVI